MVFEDSRRYPRRVLETEAAANLILKKSQGAFPSQPSKAGMLRCMDDKSANTRPVPREDAVDLQVSLGAFVRSPLWLPYNGLSIPVIVAKC